MRSISSQQETPLPERLSASLMNLIRAEIDDLVLARLRGAWHKLPELLRLAFQHLFTREIALFPVGDAQQAVVGNLCDHGEVLRADEEIGALPVELG